MTRGVQVLCCIVQLLMIYSESGSLSMFWFLLYSILCGYNLFHLSKRWYYNIDGRYDLKQFVRESEPTVRVQYGSGKRLCEGWFIPDAGNPMPTEITGLIPAPEQAFYANRCTIFTPTLMGLIIFCTIELQNGLVHSIFKLATIVQLLLAVGQLTLEFYEVYVKGN
ncbi:hypothetical protein Y032_0119g797 [Ancylostoma ceylanicum]|uniref:DUF7087 domain-containing protein n=1 Tax=Ancylostoma ceylanicum TaxID=53326 RepID=A0A016TA29_9BILA|nr:hypothetical protein Y032_0119g797 [Ancylostoma ceylanicum]